MYSRSGRCLSPLLAAALVCELLLERGNANIEEATLGGKTALNIAAGEGFSSTVELLLSKVKLLTTISLRLQKKVYLEI